MNVIKKTNTVMKKRKMIEDIGADGMTTVMRKIETTTETATEIVTETEIGIVIETEIENETGIVTDMIEIGTGKKIEKA